jgi:23S rRNA pseudouridine1911/1915/1917 synthase
MKDRLQILYEDNHVIAVVKPAGIAVQADKTGDVCLLDLVKDYLKEKYNKPGKVFLGLVHRLDQPVGGIMVFARTGKAAARLAEQFRLRQVKKLYQALVKKTPELNEADLINYLKKDSRKNIVKTYDQPTEGALKAELHYRVLKQIKQGTILEIELKTGRSHQIRAQLSHLGSPIIGDVKYGGIKWSNPRAIALNAVKLEFKHPTKDEFIKLVIDADFGNL